MMLRLLREHQLYAKLSKWSFFQTEVDYLGHVVSKEGKTVVPKKVRSIMEWEAPRNVYEVRYFMGLAHIIGDSSGSSHKCLIISHDCKGKVTSSNGQRSVWPVFSSSSSC